MRLLPHLTTAGIRPTELARRVDVSKQAVGQALGDLESRGFVEMVADPADGRARLVRLTASGLAAFDHGRDVLAFYEEALARRVGAARIAALTDALARIHVVLAEWTAAGAPSRAVGASNGRPAVQGPATPGRLNPQGRQTTRPVPSSHTALSLSHSPVRHRADALHTLCERLLDLLGEHAPEDVAVNAAAFRTQLAARREEPAA